MKHPSITSAAAVSFNEDTTANVLDIASQDPDVGTAEGKGLNVPHQWRHDASQFEVAPATVFYVSVLPPTTMRQWIPTATTCTKSK